MMKLAMRCGLTCLGLGLLACKGESELMQISSNKAALTAAENSDRALQGLVDATDFLADSTSIAQTLGELGGGGESCSSSGVFCASDSASCPPPVTVCESTGPSDADLEEMRADVREGMQELVKALRERILIPANLESETETSATYRLGPDVLCDSDAPELPGQAATPTYDPDCVEQANRLQLRLRLTSPQEGDIDVTVVVGQGHSEPLVFELYQHSLGVRVDLGEALEVVREFGEDAEDVERLAGVLELQLVENRPRDYSLELNVLQALEAVVHSDGDTLTASLGATSPALELRVDGNAKRLLAGMDLGALRVLGPLRMFADSFGSGDEELAPADYAPAPDGFAAERPAPGGASAPAPTEPSYHGMVELFLAGLQGTLEYVSDSDALNLNGLGFGDATSTIKHDGNTLLALDLNAAQGRHLDLVLEPEGDRTRISITPGFDLRLALAFHHIADQVEGVADYLLNDTWHFWFEGSNPELVVGDDQLEVGSGTLHLDSSADPASNLSVAAGMCLGEADASVESDDWRGSLAVNACQ
jgi:hypothetical protein